MRALDLFAGMGWGVACQHLGIEELGIEIMPEAQATRSAAGMVTLYPDVWDAHIHPTLNPDLLIASPPCQTFSLAGKGKGRGALDQVLAAIQGEQYVSRFRLRRLAEEVGDDRTALVLMPLYYAYDLLPTYIAWEQVPTVLPVWEACAQELEHFGYSTWTGVLSAEQYGVPQTRKRAILIARRDGKVAAPPEPTHSRYYPRDPTRLDEGVKPWVSMAEALGWGMTERPSISIMGAGTSGGGPRPLDGGSGARKTLREAMDAGRWVPRGMLSAGGNNTAGQRERPPVEPSATITGKGTAYWQGEWPYHRPSTTIVGSFKPEIVAAPGYRTTVSRQNAEGSVRVSVAEAGVLQSFPADFPWQGSRTKQFLQVGNAVPPLLAEAVLSVFTS